MDIKYMLACIFMSMGPAKHEKVVIFPGKMATFISVNTLNLPGNTIPGRNLICQKKEKNLIMKK